jgi:hypothetical protein
VVSFVFASSRSKERYKSTSFTSFREYEMRRLRSLSSETGNYDEYDGGKNKLLCSQCLNLYKLMFTEESFKPATLRFNLHLSKLLKSSVICKFKKR